MSSHLRHCPKHRKPLPCPHCALIAKPVQAPTSEIAAEPGQVTVVTMDPPKSASAIRAAKWRAKQKQHDPDCEKKEAERKAEERAEVDRVQQIEDTLRSNPVPLFVMKNAPEGAGKIETGGYDIKKIDTVRTEQDRAKGGKSVFRAPAKAVTPEGYGSSKIENTAPSNLPKEFQDSFAPKFKNPKEVRLLHQFIYENTRKSPMLVCVLCKEQIGTGKGNPGDNIAAGYDHFRNAHPEQFSNFLGRLKGTACTEDHDGMVRRHGGGALKVQCKRCKKILYKPPKAKPEPRSDRIVRTAA